MKKEKDGAVTLLRSAHFQEKNPWEQPVVGWIPTSQGVGGIFNPRGFAMPRVVVQKRDEGELRPLYDQPMIVENPGTIAVCTQGDQVGLVQNFRMVGNRLMPNAGADYVRRLNDEERWQELVESLGQWKWECPRGLAPPGTDPSDLERFVMDTAKIEANEEAGFTIKNPRICGWLNTNPTFFAHPQAVVHAEIESHGEAKHEDLEIIGKTSLFSREQVRAMVEKGELDDGLTIAGLALAGFHF